MAVVWTKYHAGRASVVFDPAEFHAGFGVPDDDLAGRLASAESLPKYTCQSLAIGAEHKRYGLASSLWICVERKEFFARVGIPDLHRVINRESRETFAVRPECHTDNREGMAGERRFTGATKTIEVVPLKP